MNNLLVNALKERVRQFGTVSLKLFGQSMYPAICNGDIITIEHQNFEDVQINDVIAYHLDKIDHFIVHRVVKIKNVKGKRVLITKGDNNNYIDANAVKQNNYVGTIRTERELNKKMENVYELAPNVLYLRDRDCVIKSDRKINTFPTAILPPVTNRANKEYNRALTTELIILLSYRCNLNCIYCSNDSGKNSESDVSVNADSVIKAITFVINNVILLRKIKRSDYVKPARIIISGGGEPTVEWKLVKLIVEIVNNFKNKYGNNIAELSILTNAQIDEEKADYLIHNFETIAISCDGFSTQDKQRPTITGEPSKANVVRFLNKLNQHNKPTSIRMTVTGEALPYLQNDVDNLLNSYKVVKNVIIEPFVRIGRGAADTIKKLDYNDFVCQFDAIVRKHYKNVYNSASLLEYANAYPCQRLSGVSLVLSPFNVITCCDTVTPKSALWDSMVVGSIENKKIRIKNRYTHSIPVSCKSCIALKFCAGGCPMQVSELDDNEKQDFCKYKQDMVKTELLRRIDLSKKAKIVENNEIRYTIYSLPWSLS